MAHEGVVPLAPRQGSTAQAEPSQFGGFSSGPYEPQHPQQQVSSPVQKSAADHAFIGTLTAIAAILASRLLLLLAVVGAFVLAVRATDNTGLEVLVAYSVITVLPLVWLDVNTRRGGK